MKILKQISPIFNSYLCYWIFFWGGGITRLPWSLFNHRTEKNRNKLLYPFTKQQTIRVGPALSLVQRSPREGEEKTFRGRRGNLKTGSWLHLLKPKGKKRFSFPPCAHVSSVCSQSNRKLLLRRPCR